MTATIHTLPVSNRAGNADLRQTPPPGIEKTPELALIMALLGAMPLETRKKVLATIETVRRSDPDGYASLAAQFIAAKLAKDN